MTLEANKLYAQLGVCMSRVGSKNPLNLTQPTWGFFDPTHHSGSKKKKKKIQPNPTHRISPTQPTWVGLNSWVGQIYYIYYYYYYYYYY